MAFATEIEFEARARGPESGASTIRGDGVLALRLLGAGRSLAGDERVLDAGDGAE